MALAMVTSSAHSRSEPTGTPMAMRVTGISKGEFNIFTMDFEPGRYALLCFVPDAGDGMPHFMHGMVQEFTVG